MEVSDWALNLTWAEIYLFQMGLWYGLKVWAGLIVKEVLDFKVGFGPGLGTD